MSKKTARDYAWDFFLDAYFGITGEDDDAARVRKCIDRAYLDMNRTLLLNDEEKGASFRKDYADALLKAFTAGATIEEKRERAYAVFFGGDRDLAAYLSVKCIENRNKRHGERFYYGQAQKWINMTLKYMWLIGLIPDSDAEKLEAPIDSVIMRAMKREIEGVKFPSDEADHQFAETAALSRAMPWSKLSGAEYAAMQRAIRTRAESRDLAPIEWECGEWIRQSALERKKRETAR